MSEKKWPEYDLAQMPAAMWDAYTGNQLTPYRKIEIHIRSHVPIEQEKYLTVVRQTYSKDISDLNIWDVDKVPALTEAELQEYINDFKQEVDRAQQFMAVKDWMIESKLVTINNK
jgi:hypothetical protein